MGVRIVLGASVTVAEGRPRQYRARLVGPFDLTHPGADSVLPRGRRARALLAYLMLGPPRQVARDTLAALLWSERGDEQARASLRQTLFELRPIVGPDHLLVVTHDTVRLNDQAILTDLAEFDRAAEQDDLAGLLATFGEADTTLLVGIRDVDPAFDEWLAHRRSQWCENRRTVALQACQGIAAARTPGLALRLAQLVVQADPLDEAATVAVMELASKVGDVATVRRAFVTLAQGLRRELDVVPSTATTASYERLVSKADPPIMTKTDLMSSGPAGRWTRLQQASRRRAIIGLGLAVVAGVGLPLGSVLQGMLVTVAAPRSGMPHASTEPDSVVTIQALTSKPGDQKAAEISDGLQSAVVRHLTGTVTPVQIVDKVQAGKPSGLAIRGSSLDDRGTLRVDIQFVATPSGEIIWAGRFERSAKELNQLEEQISIQVARELHCAYADGRQPYVDHDPELARLSLSHCDTLGHDIDEAAHYDWQITRRAPTFARGWAEYAMDTALIAEDMPSSLRDQGFAHATNFAQYALNLDPRQGLAYAALVVASQQRPLSDRLALVRAGLKADPTSPELHIRHCFLLATLGRQQDALGEAKAAYLYDHLLPPKLFNQALAELASGYVDAARHDLALGQTYWPSLPSLDEIVIALGVAGIQPDRALNLVKHRALGGVDPADAALAMFLTWRAAPTHANDLAAAKVAVDAAMRDEGKGNEIRLLALLGRFDDAYGVGDRLPNVVVDPGWFIADLRRFRGDPRFMQLMRRTGLTTAWQQTGLWPDFCAELGGIRKCEYALRGLKLPHTPERVPLRRVAL